MIVIEEDELGFFSPNWMCLELWAVKGMAVQSLVVGPKRNGILFNKTI